jgi:ppGpp synthetase/RelA/SpoT-type nucleotidyltranferase
VGEVPEQERVVASLAEIFPGASVIDRREKPSYGYRAVHIVVEVSGKTVEIQVRTTFQHIWAEISEKYADLYGSEIKYGGGVKGIRRILDRMSVFVAKFEGLEKKSGQLPESDEVRKWREAMREIRRELAELLDNEISWLDIRKGEKR